MARTFVRYIGRHHVALLALLVALGGTSYAATAIPRNSVGTLQLRKNAVDSSKVRNNALSGADVRESSLGRVPKAGEATHAKTADTATTANDAFSTSHSQTFYFPHLTPDPVLALYIPHGGNYIVTATFSALNDSSSPADVSCLLVAKADGFTTGRTQGAGYHIEPGATQVVSFQLASPLGGTGRAQLYCQVFGTAGNVGASYATITAEQFGNLTITG